MSNIKAMDCTLRDGGYINDWQFGRQCIRRTAEKLCEAALDYIECGYLSETRSAGEDRSIFASVEQADSFFAGVKKELALMVNCGEVDARRIPPYAGGITSLIRVAFHKHEVEQAKELCRALREKGYRVFFQPMVTSGYSDEELLSLIRWANETGCEAFYMVDSFGMMRKKEVLRLFYLFDNNLAPNIKIGFHSHNNLQLSFSNAQELMMIRTEREIIIDSSVLGMGRGAGNLCTELLTQYLNENFGKKYDLIPILEIMDEDIMPIYSTKPWGYSAPYYIAAINGCHPNYASYLMNRQTLCIRDINAIIKRIPADRKQLFSADLIASMYLEFQKHTVDDGAVIAELKALIQGRNVLLLAPGRSLAQHKEELAQFIKQADCVVFAVNHIPKNLPYDRVFLSNLRRVGRGIADAAEKLKDKLFCTSNLADGTVRAVNYSSYLVDVDIISDNAGLMLINVLRKAGATELYLAGFDGIDAFNADTYYDDQLSADSKLKFRSDLNGAMKAYFEKLEQSMTLHFLTPSVYRDEI